MSALPASLLDPGSRSGSFRQPPVERLLDVDGSDVVRQQQDLVGVQFLAVLPHQVGVPDQPGRLQQPDEEDAGAGERVEHVDAFVGQSPPELLAQCMVRTLENEVHHLARRIDDAEPVGVFPERDGEELLVELHQHALPGRAVVEAAGAQPDAAVEGLEVPGLVLQAELPEVPRQALEGLRDRVAAGEIVVLEQGFEDRLREQMLSQHVHRVAAADLLVDRHLEFLDEQVEPLLQRVVLPRAEKPLDAHHEALEDRGHVGSPGLPVLPVPALLHDLREDRAGRQIDRRERQQTGR